MPDVQPHKGLSLKSKLNASALGGLVITAILTALLLLTARAAGEIVSSAQQAHNRVRVYTHLHAAASDYQNASYSHVRDGNEETRRRIPVALTRFENLVQEAKRLPSHTPHEKQVTAEILLQSRQVIDHFKDADRLVQSVDDAWKRGGSQAALARVEQISQPIFAFQNLLKSESRRGDWAVAEATRDAQALIQTAVISAIIGLLIALIFTLAVHFLLRHRLQPALRQLEVGAHAFTNGNLNHRVVLSGDDELARLGSAFNAMALSLHHHQTRLRDIQADLEKTVALRTAELRKANSELSAMDDKRRAFLADIGHELRTPLTVIRGEAEVALRAAGNSDFDTVETLDIILSQTLDLTRMVDDIFVIACAQAGGLSLTCEYEDLRALTRQIVCEFDTLVRQSGGSITLADGLHLTACVDKKRVRRALGTLIENALKHCPSGVAITLGAAWTNGQPSIWVADDGPGIGAEETTVLVGRFMRGDTKKDGAGLGLSLVSALMKAHNGAVQLSPSSSKGTQVTLIFPSTPEAMEAA